MRRLEARCDLQDKGLGDQAFVLLGERYADACQALKESLPRFSVEVVEAGMHPRYILGTGSPHPSYAIRKFLGLSKREPRSLEPGATKKSLFSRLRAAW